jgi:hypothetical protein
VPAAQGGDEKVAGSSAPQIPDSVVTVRAVVIVGYPEYPVSAGALQVSTRTFGGDIASSPARATARLAYDYRSELSMVPLLGDSINLGSAMTYAQQGNYRTAALYTLKFALNVAAEGTGALGAAESTSGKTLELAAIGSDTESTSYSWSAVRSRMGLELDLPPGTPVHHWAIPQGGSGELTASGFLENQWGRFVPDSIKNAEWNLMIPPDGARDPAMGALWHMGLHGKGPLALSLPGRLWYGSPTWAKAAAISVPVAAGGAEVLEDK